MAQQEKKPISIKGVLDDLANGLDRAEIGEKYGITPAETKQLFQHPSLLGKKKRTPVSFTIIDDAPPPPEKKTRAKKTAVAEEATETAAPAQTEEAGTSATAKEAPKKPAPEGEEAVVKPTKGVW